MSKNYKKNFHRLIWELPFFFIICLLVGFIFTISHLSIYHLQFQHLWLENTITALSVGLCSFFGGFFAFFHFHQGSFGRRYILTLLASLAAAVLGRVIGLLLHWLIQNRNLVLGPDLFISSLASLSMSFILATAWFFYWQFSSQNHSLTMEDAATVVEIRSEQKIYFIEAHDILFLTADGKRTIVHTQQKDYSCNMLLKDFLQKFSVAGLIRIHKKYAAQVAFIEYIRHHSSGEYLASLQEDSILLPVSPLHLNELKEKMKKK